MRHTRRFIAAITAIAFWCIATTTSAYALRPDPVGTGVPQTPLPPASGTSLWQFLLVAGLAALMTVAVVGLIASLRHTRPTRQSALKA